MRKNKVRSAETNINYIAETEVQADEGNPAICSSSFCVDDDDTDKIKCLDCNRFVHYCCTLLPAYHLQSIISKRKPKFICSNCVTVPKDLLYKIPSRRNSLENNFILNKINENKKDKEEINRLIRDNANCASLIKALEEREIVHLEKIKLQQNELNLLKENLRTDPGFHTTEYLEQKFEQKLSDFGKAIKTSLIEELRSLNQGTEKKVTDALKKTYAAATKDQIPATVIPTLKSIIKETRDEEIAQDFDKQKRAKNIIIHSVAEPNDATKEERQKTDNEYIATLISDLRVRANVKYVGRIGFKATDKSRPIKVVFEKEDQKMSVLKSLPNLKQYDNYKGISVTEDFTQAEREIIKKWSEKAKEKNQKEEDNTVIWRVRGTPKNGLFLIKLKKKEDQI